DQDRYFDVYVEYAKADPEDFCIRLKICNRSNAKAQLHVLPTLWLRNLWSWKKQPRPGEIESKPGHFLLSYPDFGHRYLYYEGRPTPLFTENESNLQKLFRVPNESSYVKDAFHEAIIHTRKEVLNPAQKGTKAAL